MKQKRALLVGAGNWGQNWGRTLQACTPVKIAGWVDVRPGAARESARLLTLDGVYTGSDLGRAIADTEPDFVVNVTLPEAHAEVAIEAMEAGLPVLCEKPMADTMQSARAMVEASERTGQLLMISQQRRYDARLAEMRRLIEENIGPLGILNSDFYRAHPTGLLHDPMPSPLILDMAIHTFDAARFVSCADPVAVYCEDFNPSWSWFRGNAGAVAIFEMTDGLRYTYRGCWCSPGRQTTWESEWRASGPHGTVTWDGESPPRAEIVDEVGVFSSKTRQIVSEPAENAPASVAAPLGDFLHALETGETPMGECHDNIKSLAMVFSALESAASGRRVDVRLASGA